MLLVVYVSFLMIDFMFMYVDALCPPFVLVANGTALLGTEFASVNSYLRGAMKKLPIFICTHTNPVDWRYRFS